MEHMLDKDVERVLFSEEELHRRVAEIAAEIDRDYAGREPLLVSVLRGSFVFMADLVRQIHLPCTVDFMAVSSYGAGTASSGQVRIIKDLSEHIEGRDVIVVEDILDSGNTLSYLLQLLQARSPASVRLCTLLDKPSRRTKEVEQTAPTFGANRISLMNFGLEKQVTEMNRRLLAISKEAVGACALVAGDLTTTGKLLEPRGDLSYETLYQIYQEQIKALADAGADLLVAETMLSVDETVAALDAAQSVCDLPVMCTLSLEADGTALYGGNAVEAVMTLQEMGAAAVGLNCSVGPDQLEAVVANMKKVAQVPIIAKPNAGMPVINEKGEASYSMNAQDFARYTRKLVEAGAGIVGGCCGTTPEYIRELARVL